MNELREKPAEALRAALMGTLRPLWHDLPEITKDRYREKADALIITARNRGIAIGMRAE